MIEILLVEGSQLRVVPDLIPEPLRMLRALRILGVIVQILTVVVHHLLSVELVMRVRNLTDEVTHILGSLTGPVADVTGCVASPISHVSGSTRDGVAYITGCVASPVSSARDSIADVLSSTGYSAADIPGLITDPVSCITCGILDFITHVLAKVITCPFSHSRKSPIVLSASFGKLGAHAIATVGNILRIEALEILVGVPTGNELTDVLGGLTDGIAYVLSSTGYSAADIPGLITDPVTGILNCSANVLRSLPSPVAYGIRGSTDSIADVLGGVTGPVADILSSASNSITDAVKESSDSAASLFSSLTDSISDVLGGLTDGIAYVLSSVLHVTGSIADPLTSTVEETGSALFGIGSGFRSSILDVVRSITDPLTGTVKESLGAFSGFIGSARDGIANILCGIGDSVASGRPQCDIRCFLSSTRDGITNILSSLAYSIGNIVGGSGNPLPRGVVVLCLVCIRHSSEIGSKLMITSTFIVHAVVVHHIAHSLVFLYLAVDSFGTIGIRLASVPVCSVLSGLADSVADILGSIGNSPSKILSGRTTVADGIIDNTINRFSGRVRNILKGFSSILSGLPCKVLNTLSSARQRILGRIDCSLRNTRQGLGLLLVIVVRGSLLGLLRIAHHSSGRALILVLLPVLIAGDKVCAFVHSSPGSPCSIGDTLGYILSDVSSESPDILAGVLQPLDVAVVSIDAEFVLIPFHALHTVVLEAVFAVKWNASDVVFSHVHAPPFEG